jgi:4-hydroxy-3-methylbut-2-enyl diphosphate reductase
VIETAARSGPLFLAPLRLEAAALRRGAPRAEIVRVGMGPARAAATCARLSAASADARPIVLAGVAGGLVAGLAPGDVVVGSSVLGPHADPEVALPAAAQLVAQLEEAGVPVRLAPIYCSPKILRGEDARRSAAATGASVVEMEARWLTPLLARQPLTVVRVVLDTLDSEFGSRSMPRAAWCALKVLRRCAAALADWAPTSHSDPLTRSS